MKRILLLCVAFAATFCAMDAQGLRKNFKAGQSAPVFKKSFQNFKIDKSNRMELKNSMLSRAALEDYAWNPKEMASTNDMYGGLYYQDLTSLFQQEGISVPNSLDCASYFPATLTRRFSGNSVKTISTYIPEGATRAIFWIKDPNRINEETKDYEILWENEVSDFSIESGDIGDYITCPCDYVIDGTDIIVGVTVKYSRLTSNRYILFTGYEVFDGGLLIDYGEGLETLASGYSFCFYLETEGEAGLRTYDADMMNAEWTRASTGSETSLYASFLNLGSMPVTEAEFAYTLNGEEKTVKVPIQTSTGQPDTLAYLGSYVFELTDVAPATPGRYTINISSSKLNGQPDEYAPGNSVDGGVISIGESYPRTVVMEEFTGTWCGWCPRGMVALDKLSEEYGDEFIGIGVHYGDEMQASNYLNFLLSAADGFPSCAVNRMVLADPLYGLGERLWGIKDLVDVINDNPCEASVGVSSVLSADKKSLQMNAHVNMSIPSSGDAYSLAYVIVEDGVSGYTQLNYYSGAADYAEGDPDLLEFISLPEQCKPTFNHVARGIYDAFGLSGSLPNGVAAGETMYHHYTVDVPATIADLNNCAVVAMLIDNRTGEIVTAGKAALGGANTGVADATADAATEISVADGTISVSAAAGTVSVYTVDGKLVATSAVNGHARINVESGAYVVRVENGHNVSVKKVVL